MLHVSVDSSGEGQGVRVWQPPAPSLFDVLVFPDFQSKLGWTQPGRDCGDVQLRGRSPAPHQLQGAADGDTTASSADLSNLHLATAEIKQPGVVVAFPGHQVL